MGTIRITSGILKGRSLHTPGGKTHPMGERERLALFNMINEHLPGAEIIDAFSGSGALGVEALSRGAKRVVFIEKDPQAVRTIRQNLAELKIDGEVLMGNVLDFQDTKLYDLIIADPPYDKFEIKSVEHLTQFLKPGGLLVLSHPDKDVLIAGLKLLKTKKYAAARISIYSK